MLAKVLASQEAWFGQVAVYPTAGKFEVATNPVAGELEKVHRLVLVAAKADQACGQSIPKLALPSFLALFFALIFAVLFDFSCDFFKGLCDPHLAVQGVQRGLLAQEFV